MMRVWVAKLETVHFLFEAYGCTEEDAVEVMRGGWRAHRFATGASLRWDDVKDDVITQPVDVGSCYRDGNEINYEPGKVSDQKLESEMAPTRRLL